MALVSTSVVHDLITTHLLIPKRWTAKQIYLTNTTGYPDSVVPYDSQEKWTDS